MEYYLTMRTNEILPLATMWMGLECIMLSEKSVRERQKSYVFTHMWNLRNLTDEHRGREGKIKKEREANHKKFLNTENKLRVDGDGLNG